MAPWRRELAEAEDPQARLAELEDYYSRYTSPFLTAEQLQIEDIVHPRETRPLLCEWVREAYELLPEQLGPTARGMRR